MSTDEIGKSSPPHRQPRQAPHAHLRTRTPERLLTVLEAADILKCSSKTVRRRIEDGSLRAIRIDGLVRIDPADLQDFVRDHRSR